VALALSLRPPDYECSLSRSLATGASGRERRVLPPKPTGTRRMNDSTEELRTLARALSANASLRRFTSQPGFEIVSGFNS
jgi:hypothetical protein